MRFFKDTYVSISWVPLTISQLPPCPPSLLSAAAVTLQALTHSVQAQPASALPPVPTCTSRFQAQCLSTYAESRNATYAEQTLGDPETVCPALRGASSDEKGKEMEKGGKKGGRGRKRGGGKRYAHE